MPDSNALPASAGAVASPSTARRLYRRVAWRIMPILLLAYVLSFLDRINVGYAQLQMKHDLGFSDAVYGLGAGLFFVTYLLFELPSNLLMERIGARATFLRIMLLWGLASAATAFVSVPWQFYGLRLLLGACEAGFFPGVILYLTYWFPGALRGRMTALFLFAMPLAGIVGGPLSGQIMQHLDGRHGLHGWQWLFIVEGLPTLAVAVLVYLALPDSPRRARWLLPGEQAQIVSDCSRGAGAAAAAHAGLARLLRDRTVYLLGFIYLCCTSSAYALTFWLPTLLRESGFSNLSQLGLFSAVPYLFGALGVLVIGFSSDRLRERRWHVALSLVLGAAALAASTVLPAATIGPATLLMLLCVAAFFIFGAGLFWSIPPTYLPAQASAAGIALISSMGILGGFLSPVMLGWFKSSFGDLRLGLWLLSAVIATGGLCTALWLPRRALRVQ